MALGLFQSNVTPIGVDFGVSSLKVLQLSVGDAPTLVAAACIETPDELVEKDDDRFAWQAEQLPAVMKGMGFKGKRAICSVSAQRTLVQHVPTPKIEGLSVLDAAKEQLRVMTGREPGSMIVRHFEVGEVTRGGVKCTEVILMAMPRDIVLTHVRALKNAKLECVGVHCEHLATVRAFDSITRRMADSDLTSLYLDIGYGSTKVMMSHGKDLVFAKTLPVGGRAFDLAIAKELDCTPVMARKRRCTEAASLAWTPEAAQRSRDNSRLAAAAAGARKLMQTTAGGGEDAAGSVATIDVRSAATDAAAERSRLIEAVEAMTEEISMCLRYEQALFPSRTVGRSIFVGGEARQTELCRAIAKALRLPAQVADPMLPLRTGTEGKVRGLERDKAQPGWTVPIGLCLMPANG
jgi:Tfp pilus assembly PilM family ATPase